MAFPLMIKLFSMITHACTEIHIQKIANTCSEIYNVDHTCQYFVY